MPYFPQILIGELLLRKLEYPGFINPDDEDLEDNPDDEYKPAQPRLTFVLILFSKLRDIWIPVHRSARANFTIHIQTIR